MIWCVEDDPSIRDIEVYALVSTGFEARGFEDGTSFWDALQRSQPELVVLDVMLPGIDGVELLKRMKASEELQIIPVIMATAKGTEYDKIQSLDLGADDYLAKPFHLAELTARVRSVLRRKHRDGDHGIEHGNVQVFPDRFLVKVSDRPLELSRKEYDILHYFMNRPNRMINKHLLAESVWGDHIDQADNFDFIYAQIKNLRKKLKDAGASIEIKAVYGLGYKLIID